MDYHTAVYRIYLLTIWQHPSTAEPPQSVDEKHAVMSDGVVTWCFTLEDPRTGQRRSFSSVIALAAALQAEFTGERW